jgi:hypothetical protein
MCLLAMLAVFAFWILASGAIPFKLKSGAGTAFSLLSRAGHESNFLRVYSFGHTLPGVVQKWIFTPVK